MNVILAALLATLAVPAIFLFMLFWDLLLAFPLLYAWNYVIPELFKLPSISYWQAFALLIVATLLVKGSSSSSSK